LLHHFLHADSLLHLGRFQSLSATTTRSTIGDFFTMTKALIHEPQQRKDWKMMHFLDLGV